MSVIGKNIKKYRIIKNITQEQLGKLVGVTTQAVSKWERGGTPDAELLPVISKVLGVSIDALFGQDEKSMVISIIHTINNLSVKDSYDFIFKICMAIEVGLMRDNTTPDDVTERLIDEIIYLNNIPDSFGKIIEDCGVSSIRISPDFHHFFFMQEPEKGIRNTLMDIDALRNIFKILSDKIILTIIYYLYTRLNTPIAVSLISKNTGINEKDVEQAMETLCENNLARKSTVATADGEICSYIFTGESSVITLLCFADELCRKKITDVVWRYERNIPLLYQPEV